MFMASESREKFNFLFRCWIRELAMKLQKLHFADKVVRLRKVVLLKHMFVVTAIVSKQECLLICYKFSNIYSSVFLKLLFCFILR